MLPSCSLKMPITPTGKNKMKPNLRSYFSQTSLSQPQNRARQMHWDAGSNPNSVSLVLRSSIKEREKTVFLSTQANFWSLRVPESTEATSFPIYHPIFTNLQHSRLPCSIWLCYAVILAEHRLKMDRMPESLHGQRHEGQEPYEQQAGQWADNSSGKAAESKQSP